MFQKETLWDDWCRYFYTSCHQMSSVKALRQWKLIELRFTSHSVQNKSIRRRSAQPISWLVLRKQNQNQQKRRNQQMNQQCITPRSPHGADPEITDPQPGKTIHRPHTSLIEQLTADVRDVMLRVRQLCHANTLDADTLTPELHSIKSVHIDNDRTPKTDLVCDMKSS